MKLIHFTPVAQWLHRLLLATALLALPALAQAQEPAPPAAAAHAPANPYGLEALWRGGDAIARGTLVAMGLMSAISWYLLCTKLWQQARLQRQARAAGALWEASSLEEGAGRLAADNTFRQLLEDGLRARRHHDGRLTDQIDLPQWITLSLQRSVEGINSELQDGLAFLATVGSTAPFIGLFGTVWGIYHALIAIGVSGQASIDQVAGPVGEALIMTALGLAVAVPAVLGYNWLVRRNKLAMEQVRRFAADVHACLLTGIPLTGAVR